MDDSVRIRITQLAGLLGGVLIGATALASLVWWGAGAVIESAKSGADAISPEPQPAAVYDTVESSDGEFSVVVSERNCGATCRFRTYVDIAAAGQPDDEGDGQSILVIDGHPDVLEIDIEWTGERSLSITRLVTPNDTPLVEESSVAVGKTVFSVEHNVR